MWDHNFGSTKSLSCFTDSSKCTKRRWDDCREGTDCKCPGRRHWGVVFVGDAVLLFYSNGVEQLGTESAKKCLRWVSAIWYVLYCRLLIYPMTCLGRSLIVLSQFKIGPKHSRPAALRTTQLMASTSTRPGSAMSGSHSTTFLPPMESVPYLSDFRSLSGSSAGSLSRQPSLQSALLLMLQSPTKQSSTWIELRSRTCRCHHQRRFAC